MLAVITTEDTNSGFDTPAGWTLVLTDSPAGASLAVFRRIAGASEPADYVFTWSSSDAVRRGVIATYAGPVAAVPIDVSGSSNAKDSTSNVPAPSVTTTGVAERLVCIYTVIGSATWTDPAGMTRRFANASIISILITDMLVSDAGATGVKTAIRSTSTAEYEFGVALALNAA